MLRLRPSDPITPFTIDSTTYSILYFIGIKNAIRRIFMSLATNGIFNSNETRDKTMFLLEVFYFLLFFFDFLKNNINFPIFYIAFILYNMGNV